MDIQISISEGTLKIESKKLDICKTYTKSDLNTLKPLKVNGQFSETEKICFIYKLDKNEKNCNLFISKCKDKIIRENSGEARTFIYNWKPINYAGIFDVVLEITTSDGKLNKFHLHLDVKSKFVDENNIDNFSYLLNSLRKKHFDIFNILYPSQVPKDIGKRSPAYPLEQFKILDRNMKKLEKIIFQISLNPNKKLIKKESRDKFYNLDTVDYNVIYDIATQRGGLIDPPNDHIAPELQNLLIDSTSGKKHLPDNVITYKTVHTYNVFENQLLKRFLTLMELCSKQVEFALKIQKKNKNLKQREKDKLEKCINKCKKFRTKAQYMKKYSFLDEVQETDNIGFYTHILQREDNYMQFYSIFKEFIRTSLFDSTENLSLPIIDIPTLYEYWAVIQIIDILSNMQDSWKKKEHFIIKNEFDYSFKLKSGKESLMELSNDDKKISLYYQKNYPTYAKRTVIPDISLEMKINDKLIKILILDPKYRSKLFAGDFNDPESALNKMHVYKDAIRRKMKNDYAHIVDAAYVIYLGEPKQYPDDVSTDIIGGIKLLPRENEDIGKKNLEDVIQRFFNSI